MRDALVGLLLAALALPIQAQEVRVRVGDRVIEPQGDSRAYLAELFRKHRVVPAFITLDAPLFHLSFFDWSTNEARKAEDQEIIADAFYRILAEQPVNAKIILANGARDIRGASMLVSIDWAALRYLSDNVMLSDIFLMPPEAHSPP